MDTIETLRHKLHIAIDRENKEIVLEISRQLDQELVKYLKGGKN